MFMFQPKNTTSHTHPCDSGIIRDLQHKYRSPLLKRMLQEIDANPTISNFKPNVLDAIRLLCAACDSVKEGTLRREEVEEEDGEETS